MNIRLNNREEEFEDNITLNDIIKLKNYTFKMIITIFVKNLSPLSYYYSSFIFSQSSSLNQGQYLVKTI